MAALRLADDLHMICAEMLARMPASEFWDRLALRQMDQQEMEKQSRGKQLKRKVDRSPQTASEMKSELRRIASTNRHA